MLIHVAEIEPYGSPILVAIVPSEFTVPGAGDDLIKRIERHCRVYVVMLVSVEINGFRAHANFQTHVILVLIQLEYLDLVEVDLSIAPPEEELPF